MKSFRYKIYTVGLVLNDVVLAWPRENKLATKMNCNLTNTLLINFFKTNTTHKKQIVRCYKEQL